MAVVKVVAGDLTNGKWQYGGIFSPTSISKGESIDLKTQTESIEPLNAEKVKKLAGTAGWGIAGAALLGPLGAIGGMLLGGNKTEVAFSCTLKDGRQFMATTDGKTWQKIMAATFNRRTTNS